MKKIGKIFTFLLLTILFTVAFVACGGDKEPSATPVSSFEYEVTRRTVTITKFIGEETDVVFPKTIESFPVVAIGKNAFNGHKTLTSIYIPEGVTEIGNSAFKKCTALTTVTFPKGFTSVAGEAFTDCEKIETVKIPSLSDWLSIDFENMYSNPLHENADFYVGGKIMTDIEIPDTITAVGRFSFVNGNFSKLKIPASVTSIGSGAFRDSKITQVIFEEGSLTEIGVSAFQACKGLTQITLPDSVTSLGMMAFNECTALESIKLSSKLTTLSDYVFRYCENLKSIIVPSLVEKIGTSAFIFCISLKYVVIPQSVTSVSLMAFGNCLAIKAIYYKGTDEDWDDITINFGNDILVGSEYEDKIIIAADRYYYSDSEPTEEGDYWHYIDGVPTVWQIAPQE